MFIGSMCQPDGSFRRTGSAESWTPGVQSRFVDLNPIGLGSFATRSSRFRGGRFLPVIRGNDGDAISFGLWACQTFAIRNEQSDRGQIELIKLGEGTATASAMVGGNDDRGEAFPIGPADRVADTVTWTPEAADTLGGALLAALTSASIIAVSPATASSPAPNTPGGLIVPDLGAQYAAAGEIWSPSSSIEGRMLVSLWS